VKKIIPATMKWVMKQSSINEVVDI
jgi:hypothetical protein